MRYPKIVAGSFAALLLLFAGNATAAGEDRDSDGVEDSADNCPDTPNPSQADFNGDGVGDHCSDADNDGRSDYYEINHMGTDPEDPDSDGDGVDDGTEFYYRTDPLSDDTDGDGVKDDSDNCVRDANPEQRDFDGDGRGDACDNDAPPTAPGAPGGPSGIEPTTPDTATTMARDGYVIVADGLNGKVFRVEVRGPEGNRVPLALPDGTSTSNDATVTLVPADDSPERELEVSWRYVSRQQQVFFTLPESVSGAFRFKVPPVGYSQNCTSEPTPCGTHAEGFFNSAKLYTALDALDAVPQFLTFGG